MTKTISRVLVVVLGALLVEYGAALPHYATGVLTMPLAVGLLAVGLLCIIAAVTETPVKYASRLAAVALALGSVAGVWVAATATGPTTDAFTFTQYAGELLLQGENPYPASMEPAFERYARDPLRPTYRVDGSRVTTYSYPAGSILYAAVGAAGTAWLSNTFYVLLTVFLSASGTLAYIELPEEIAALAPISLLAAGNLWFSAAGGIIDSIWLLPLVATMAYWRRDHLRRAGLCFGLAVAAKQQPWIIAPAAVLVLWRTSPASRRVERVWSFVAPATAVFAVINAPFLIADPVAWLEGVFVAVDVTKPSIIQDGVGLVTLSTSGTLQLSSALLGGLTVASMAAAYAVVYLRPQRFRHAIWVLPPLVLFWSPRSLASYFTMFTPVAVVALGNYIHAHQSHAR
ncbi:hypothetical protein [Halobacterium hubeiense]|uniref:hypothetical protein n=1 Tax=Halobacterium hubeiense TaxID=1407499 RepID=UPI003C70F1AE